MIEEGLRPSAMDQMTESLSKQDDLHERSDDENHKNEEHKSLRLDSVETTSAQPMNRHDERPQSSTQPIQSKSRASEMPTSQRNTSRLKSPTESASRPVETIMTTQQNAA